MSETAGSAPAAQSPAAVQLSPTKIAGAALIAGIVALLMFILYVAVLPAQWEFSLQIETEVAQLSLQPGTETRWRIDGATLCSRTDLAVPEEFRLTNSGRVCGSRAWRGWRIDAPEQVIVIDGAAAAVLETTGSGLAISLRSESQSLGSLSVIGLIDAMELGNGLNLIWNADSASGTTFPFTGTTTLGRAVSWSDPRMLRSGSVAVYTSDESADQRKLVDEAVLMLGDQVKLGKESDTVWPKGFIRVASGSAPMQVVAFGRAEGLSIERFGDSGYDFKPGYLTKLAGDAWIAFWGSLLLVAMTLIPGLLPFVEGDTVKPDGLPARYRYLRWLLRYRKE